MFCFIGKYIMKNIKNEKGVSRKPKEEKAKPLSKKEMERLLMELDSNSEISFKLSELLETNPKSSQRERNFNLSLFKLILNSVK